MVPDPTQCRTVSVAVAAAAATSAGVPPTFNSNIYACLSFGGPKKLQFLSQPPSCRHSSQCGAQLALRPPGKTRSAFIYQEEEEEVKKEERGGQRCDGRGA